MAWLLSLILWYGISSLFIRAKETKLESVLYRTSCPCVINAAENSPELEEIKRINLEYQVKAKSYCNSPYFLMGFLIFYHYSMLFFFPGWDRASYFWKSLWRKRRLCCCPSTLFTELLHTSYWSKLQTYACIQTSFIMKCAHVKSLIFPPGGWSWLEFLLCGLFPHQWASSCWDGHCPVE